MSFWVRLHRSPKAYIEKSEGTRTIQVYSNSQVVAETTFLLTSYEWVLIKPSASAGTIIGNTLLVQAGTDVDSIVISWGDNVKYNSRIQLATGTQPIQKFQAWKVV